jgi:nucleotide-binding universal stress UspA family protein
MHFQHSFRYLVLLLTASVVVIAGCGGSDDKGDSKSKKGDAPKIAGLDDVGDLEDALDDIEEGVEEEDCDLLEKYGFEKDGRIGDCDYMVEELSRGSISFGDTRQWGPVAVADFSAEDNLNAAFLMIADDKGEWKAVDVANGLFNAITLIDEDEKPYEPIAEDTLEALQEEDCDSYAELLTEEGAEKYEDEKDCFEDSETVQAIAKADDPELKLIGGTSVWTFHYVDGTDTPSILYQEQEQSEWYAGGGTVTVKLSEDELEELEDKAFDRPDSDDEDSDEESSEEEESGDDEESSSSGIESTDLIGMTQYTYTYTVELLKQPAIQKLSADERLETLADGIVDGLKQNAPDGYEYHEMFDKAPEKTVSFAQARGAATEQACPEEDRIIQYFGTVQVEGKLTPTVTTLGPDGGFAIDPSTGSEDPQELSCEDGSSTVAE